LPIRGCKARKKDVAMPLKPFLLGKSYTSSALLLIARKKKKRK